MVCRSIDAGRLRFTADVQEAVSHGVVQFIVAGSSADEDVSVDLTHVLAAATSIGQCMMACKVVVDKSTAHAGTAETVQAEIAGALSGWRTAASFGLVSHLKLLKEGAAVEDLMCPDRIIGVDVDLAMSLMLTLCSPFQRNLVRLIVMYSCSPEPTTYATNALRATRISFMDELANPGETLGGGDIEPVRRGIGSAPSIGYRFLCPGCGYGSVLPQ